MKIRYGFVSNSSSSSFVVAVKQTGVCPTCNRGDTSFLDRFIRNPNDYEVSQIYADTVGTILDRQARNYGDDISQDELEALRQRLQKYVNDGYRVGYISISYSDESLSHEMDRLKRSGDLVVIKDMN